MTRPPAPALSDAEAATVARFDAARVPSEVLVEAVARALWEADHDRTAWEDATQDGPDNYRRLAAAAIAAMPPTADAEKRAAAKALRDAAAACEAHGNSWRQVFASNSAPFAYARWLHARTDALDPS